MAEDYEIVALCTSLLLIFASLVGDSVMADVKKNAET